jgi:hypothetical protein
VAYLNRLDVQRRHAGIKARHSGNEKRGERLSLIQMRSRRYLFLLMPDHLHALLFLPPSGKPLQLVVSKWKKWTAKELGIVWQRDFSEHRLRHDESRREKADYILQNPVRKKLLTRPEEWPFVCFADGGRTQFDRQEWRASIFGGREGALRRPVIATRSPYHLRSFLAGPAPGNHSVCWSPARPQ